ncbi:alanyl-tRNA editing protein [Vibrio coralliilyticus]|uniref:alanine--tRNA ligase-related protein n=1 Tax=Vibrio coralliilyticus TaxID=190893 RepID=UPI000BAAB040|nr:alanyl-tRNA editing protein [Vibrio coralliilyticus]PAU40115.1 alanyl-tRNA editing protein [Vibrio coralliilyticus]
MTVKVFWENPYQIDLLSTVSWIEGRDIKLDKTIFYAESGGQESDEGTIAGIQVEYAQKQGTEIIYTLASEAPFQVGDEVITEINWARRYALMKLHFAAEVVLELFTQRYPDIEKIGAHIGQDKSRIDFVWPESLSPLLPEFENKAQALINKGQLIESQFEDEAKQRRFWRVEGFAQVACGGTHLKRTSEVGSIALKRKNIGRGKERVEIRLVV